MEAATFGWLCVETVTTKIFVRKLKTQPPSGGCVLKQSCGHQETAHKPQPPSGGCVLKQHLHTRKIFTLAQPPSGGCVLKHHLIICAVVSEKQPPSGGCVLKRFGVVLVKRLYLAATFGWLCVETGILD